MSTQEQQSRLKELIARGKEQGYITYAEVNDHLPDEISDPDQIEDIIRMINDMGITVYETAPDADELLNAGENTADEIGRGRSCRRAGRSRNRSRSDHRSGAHVYARNGYG